MTATAVATSAAKISLPVVPVGTPVWWVKLVSAVLLIGGPALTLIDPGGKIPSQGLEAAIVIVFIAAALIFYTIHLIHINGLTKAGIAKTVSEDEQWVINHATELRTLYTEAKPALDAVPGLPALVTGAQGEIEALAKRFDQLTGVDIDALAERVKARIVADSVRPQTQGVGGQVTTVGPSGTQQLT